jgi:hemerythrin-like metal-binding protein
MLVGEARWMLGRLFSELVDYTRYHFSTEERLMQHHAYRDYAAHKMEHDALTEKALDLRRRWQAGRIGLSIETSELLQGWLAHHIRGIDKQLGTFLNGKGVF